MRNLFYKLRDFVRWLLVLPSKAANRPANLGRYRIYSGRNFSSQFLKYSGDNYSEVLSIAEELHKKDDSFDMPGVFLFDVAVYRAYKYSPGMRKGTGEAGHENFNKIYGVALQPPTDLRFDSDRYIRWVRTYLGEGMADLLGIGGGSVPSGRYKIYVHDSAYPVNLRYAGDSLIEAYSTARNIFTLEGTRKHREHYEVGDHRPHVYLKDTRTKKLYEYHPDSRLGSGEISDEAIMLNWKDVQPRKGQTCT